ncbi:hypothetical protein M9H77_11520 [Catharanthus roseus]|uniref:Uncharacterized protein n=1 Tax=Catharanthus roseus TaxID=4058 RepID=A0ACC0BEV8_CATRO|nr:hypothetical protein M9H77_11520 [Catharanthus roseus]
MEDEDSDFLKSFNAEYTSILDDPKPGFSIDCGDDPSYALFLSSLKNDGSSYVLEANEKTGLTMPLKYMENDPNGEDENDLDSHAKTEGIEFQRNYDCDYKLFFENTRLEGSNVIYQYKNGASVVYDGLIFLNSQTDDNVTYKKRKYTDAIQHETISKGINYPFPLFWILLSNRSFFNFPSIYCEYFLSNFCFVLVPLLSQRMSKAIVAIHNKQCDLTSGHCGHPQQTMCSNFRVQILEILRKPYDKEEHERLMQEITKWKPQHKHRDLRSGRVKFYPSDKMGKSLLDHHLVLKRKIEEAVAANNDLKQLNLLRGFFFWLQNLTDDESFIPWNNKECVDV